MERKISEEIFNRNYKYPIQCMKALWVHRTKPEEKCSTPYCPGKLDKDYFPMKAKRAYYCKICLKRLYVRVDSIFHDLHFDIAIAFKIIFDMLRHRDGISADYIARNYAISPVAAHRFMHRVRIYMGQCIPSRFYNQVVEMDEAFKSAGNMGLTRYFIPKPGLGSLDAKIVGMVARNGTAILKHVIAVDENTIRKLTKEHIDPSCTVYTDENTVYNFLKDEVKVHETVNHGLKEYVRGPVSTNNIEGLFSRLKTTLETYGSIHYDSIQNYCNEVAFKHSYKDNDDYGFGVLLENLSPISLYYRNLN